MQPEQSTFQDYQLYPHRGEEGAAGGWAALTSEHNFSAMNKNEEDTLGLSQEFGRKIFCYPHNLGKSIISRLVKGGGCRAFLSSLEMREKFIPQGDDRLIYHSSVSGPVFGDGLDIFISDGCNSNSHLLINLLVGIR